ncbi:prepilin-type N-terminal cleavage/methylation domain-containing protein [Neobacillus sp. FSL H8-0543]|uniref:prepilin-type N-terminal cleavage/methylation domain-containing protein n=1 Tax=Neobacillus sp. FSL H8-0543 TaxID=2954672 RepID=UPI0031598DDB
MIKKLGLKLKEQKGFTLIELLAVIVILGIIAAIAIPAIGNVISKSDNKAKVQDGLLIINAAKLYVANNPDTVTGTVFIGPEAATPAVTDIDLSDDYLDRVKDKTFKLTVTKNSTSGKYSYELTTHNSITLVDGKDGTAVDTKASEAELLEYSN